jgi:hypothetical protein
MKPLRAAESALVGADELSRGAAGRDVAVAAVPSFAGVEGAVPPRASVPTAFWLTSSSLGSRL